ncbi:hypothetical protein ACMYYO_12360 [Dermacoccaceae bacterium W4C1]
MQLLRNRVFVVVYWLVALVVSLWVGGLIASWSTSSAGSGGEGDNSTNGAQLIYGAVGFVVGLLGCIAIFAAIWLGLWAQARRVAAAEAAQHGGPDYLDEHDGEDADLDTLLTDDDLVEDDEVDALGRRRDEQD